MGKGLEGQGWEGRLPATPPQPGCGHLSFHRFLPISTLFFGLWVRVLCTSTEALVRMRMGVSEPFWRAGEWNEAVEDSGTPEMGKTVLPGKSQIFANFLIFLLWSS